MKVGSLFTGVGGFDLGLECARMDVVWQVEADKWCRQVLRSRWPDVNLYGDVKDVGRSDLDDVDLICGGFPCQDLSVAGNREGLDSKRSGLWFEFLRIADSVAPRWVLIENVPGLLSSNDGEDFAVLLGGLTGFHPEVPDDGWEDGGYCEGPKRRAFWRVLDTQHFGPPQRRRRVFIVADSRARCGPEVLLEPESVPGHPATRREAGEGAAGESADGFTETGRGWWKRGKARLRGQPGGMPQNVVAETLRVGSRDQGAGNAYDNTPWTIAFNATQDPINEEEKNPALSDQGAAVAFKPSHYTRGKDGAPSFVHPPLSADADRGDQDPAVFHENIGGDVTGKDHARALREGASHSYQFVSGTSPTIRAREGGGGWPDERDPEQIMGPIPRRLTPVECERLQGFPDDWTAEGVDANGEPTEISDTQRYKQLGNAVSVPVSAWIGARIIAAEMEAIDEC